MSEELRNLTKGYVKRNFLVEPNCGGLSYDGHYLCSPKCEKEYEEYLNGGE